MSKQRRSILSILAVVAFAIALCPGVVYADEAPDGALVAATTYSDGFVGPLVVEPQLSYDYVKGVVAGEYAYMSKKVKTGDGESDYAWVRDIVHVTDGAVMIHTADEGLAGCDIPGGDTDLIWSLGRWGDDAASSYISVTSHDTGEKGILRPDGTGLFPLGAYDAFAFCWSYSSYHGADLVAAKVDGGSMRLDIVEGGVVVDSITAPYEGKLPTRVETGSTRQNESRQVSHLANGFMKVYLGSEGPYLYLRNIGSGFELVDEPSLEWTPWEDGVDSSESARYAYTLADGTYASSVPGVVGGSLLIAEGWVHPEGGVSQGTPVVRSGYTMAIYHGDDVPNNLDGSLVSQMQHAGKDMFWATDEFECEGIHVTKTGKWGVIDTAGNVVLPVVYDAYCDLGFENTDWALVKQGGKWKFVKIVKGGAESEPSGDSDGGDPDGGSGGSEPAPTPAKPDLKQYEGAAAASGMSDLKPGEWFMDPATGAFPETDTLYLDYTIARGLMGGYAGDRAGQFGPHDTLSRAQTATILYRLANPGSKATTDPAAYEDNGSGLPDVASKQYYTAAVNWCVEQGVITGYRDAAGRYYAFGPDDAVAREQLATMIFRYCTLYAGREADAADITAFSDYSKISDWARAGVAYCAANRIVGGYTDGSGRFGPQDSAERCQMAKIIAVTAYMLE